MLNVNTDAVVNTAKTIHGVNSRINNRFNDLNRSITRMDNAWNGQASGAAVEKFYRMKNDFYQPRYDVLENFNRFLLQQIGQGYEETENVNKSLSEAFK